MDKSLQQEENNNTAKAREVIAGLDIGTTKVVCFIAQRDDHGKIDIIGVGKTESAGVSRGEVVNIAEATESIRRAVQMAQDNLRIPGQLTLSKVCVGIAGSHINSFQHENMISRKDPNSLITEKELSEFRDQVLSMNLQNGEKIIDAIPQEYYIDNNPPVHRAAGCQGAQIKSQFHVISGQMNKINLINTCVNMAGLQIHPLVLEPIASAEAVLSKEEKEGGVVLVDIGGGTTDVAIVHEHKIRHTAVIPFGGDVITRDIKEGCHILKSQAEKLKTQFGSAIPTNKDKNEVISIAKPHGAAKEISKHTLAGIIQARLTEIIGAVNYEINQSGYRDKILGGIVVTGGGSQMNHIKQLFEFVTGMDTRLGLPTEHLSANTDIAEFSNPIFSTGIGLVLKGFQHSDHHKKIEPEKTIGQEIPEEPTRPGITDFFAKFKKMMSDNMGSLMDDSGLK